jgi:hypothetical protein
VGSHVFGRPRRPVLATGDSKVAIAIPTTAAKLPGLVALLEKVVAFTVGPYELLGGRPLHRGIRACR